MGCIQEGIPRIVCYKGADIINYYKIFYDETIGAGIAKNNGDALHYTFLRIKEKYGKYFFQGMADNYDEPYLSEEVWQALIDTNYPMERFEVVEDTNDWEDVASLAEVIAIDPNPCISLSFVIDAFIWLLNAYGAEIIPSDDDIPMICNWTCHGFETVGYGCFYM